MSEFFEKLEHKSVQLTDGKIYYREAGEGETLVFIHGLLVNGTLWRKLIPVLSQHYRCIVPDLPLGAQPEAMHPNTDLTPPGIAKIIAEFITALNLAPVTLVGCDTGGALCQISITEYPHLFNGLILTNCDAYSNFLPPLFRPLQWMAYLPKGMSLVVKLLTLKIGFKNPFGFVPIVKHPMDKRTLWNYFKYVNNPGVRRDGEKFLKSINNKYTLKAAKKFGEFQHPVLIVWATEDLFFTVGFGRKLHAAFPNASLKLVKDSFAFISEDQPEILVEHMQEFLANRFSRAVAK
jgi:pimeloyl-ACP methyl ester carboxylesterase